MQPMRATSYPLCVYTAWIAAVVAACSDQHPSAPTPSTLATQIIVSAPSPQINPVLASSEHDSHITPVFLRTSTTLLVYVSLPPGSVESGSSATIQNRRTGNSVDVILINGGFDPTPIEAVTGDDLTINIHGASSPLLATVRVPKRRPPTVVRTEPPNGKTDVPLNMRIEVVFSEPIDPATVASAVQLLEGAQAVTGAATAKSLGLVAEYTPDASLAPLTQYTVMITTGIHDLAGDALEQSVRINFITGPGTYGGQPPVGNFSCSFPTIYSFASGTSVPVGSMSQIHGDLTTLLPDGRVVIFGGTSFESLVWGGLPDTTIRPVAEVYDPTAKRFSPADDMITYRGSHPAVLLSNGNLQFFDGTVLQDGRVFFAGSNSAEIYDPVAGTLMPTGPYAHTGPEISWNTRTVLLDGRVLLTGSVGTPQQFFGATELFDPRTGTFKKTGDMQGFGDTPGLGILLEDGTVMIVQWYFDIGSDNVELYDPATETFNTVGCIYDDHEYSAAVRLRDGRILITGGQLPGGNGSTDVLLYVPSTHNFVYGTPMNIGRHSHSATLLLDGTVLVAGGYSVWPNPTRTAEIIRLTP